VREIAERLGVSKPTALSMLRRGEIPGAEMIYRDDQGKQHWRVERPIFEEWIASLRSLRN
jgi:excisionase family DNA binding protein